MHSHVTSLLCIQQFPTKDQGKGKMVPMDPEPTYGAREVEAMAQWGHEAAVTMHWENAAAVPHWLLASRTVHQALALHYVRVRAALVHRDAIQMVFNPFL